MTNHRVTSHKAIILMISKEIIRPKTQAAIRRAAHTLRLVGKQMLIRKAALRMAELILLQLISVLHVHHS